MKNASFLSMIFRMYLIVCLFLFGWQMAGAQSYNAMDLPLPIPLIGTGGANCSGGPTVSIINASLPPGELGLDYVIDNVTIGSLIHTWTADIDITLIAPNGSMIDLSSGNGGLEDDYLNTVFMDGFPPITGSIPPFTGTFSPEQALSQLDGPANGNWSMSICDGFSGDNGTLEAWSITFTDISPCELDLFPIATQSISCPGFCDGSIVLSVTNPQDPLSLYFYSLDNGQTFQEANGDSIITITGLCASNYSILLVDQNTGECSGTINIEIGSTPPIIADIKPDEMVCEGDSINLSVAIMNGLAPFEFAWTGPESFSSTQQAIPIFANQGIYFVSVTDANSCTAADSLTIHSTPEVVLNANSPCEGQNLTLFASASGSIEPYDFVWKKPDGNLILTPAGETSMLPLTNTSLTNAGIYEITVTDALGCSTTESISVTVGTNPNAAPSNTIKLCHGEKLYLTANWAPFLASEEEPTYYWTGPDGFKSLEANPQISDITTFNAGKYWLYLTNDFGCESEFCTEVVVEDCAVGTAYEPNDNNYKSEPCACAFGDCPNSSNLSDGSELENTDVNSFEGMPPPRTIQVLSKAVKITRPNVVGPAPCGCEFNTYTGNVFIKVPLFTIPSQGPDLAFTMVYNSGKTDINHGYGNGWTWNYNLMWERQTDSLLLRRGDGRLDIFIFDGNVYHAPPGISDTLIEVATDQFVLRNKYGKEFHFENAIHRRLTKIIDRNDNELTITHSDSLATKITDATGRVLQLAYEDGLLKTVTESNSEAPRTIRLEYDGHQNLRRVIDPMGYTRKYIYDLNRNIIQVTGPNGNQANLEYDDNYAVTSLRSAISTTTINYDTDNAETIVTEPVGDSLQITRYGFTGVGNIAFIMGACCGFDVQYEYDEENNLTKITDANNNVYQYKYDIKGNVTKEIDPLSNEQTFEWTIDFNQLAYWKDKNGYESNCEFDATGNVVRINEPLDISREFAWQPKGLFSSTTDAEGHITSFVHDIHGNQISVQYPIGIAHFGYDEIGNRTISITPNGDTTRFEYDLRNLLIKTIDPFGNKSEMRYDGNRNRIWSKNKRGFISTRFFNAQNRMVKLIEPLSVTTEFGYDEKGNRIYLKDPNGNETLFKYDTRNLLIQVTNPLGDQRFWQYDANGNRIKKTNYRGFSTTYAYNALNRIIEITNALGFTTTYAYDANGNNIEIKSPDGVKSTFSYDEVDRILKKQHSFSKSDMTYNKNGNLKTRTDANNNTTEFEYDANNRIVLQKNTLGQTISFGYDANGNQTETIDRKGNLIQTIYDGHDRPIVQINAQGDSMFIVYDEGSNRLSVRNERGFMTRFGYDELDRLIKITKPIGEEKYEYDTNGNRITKTDAEGRSMEIKYDALDRRIKTTFVNGSETSQTYDENGNTTASINEEGEMTSYIFDPLDQLINVTNQVGETTSSDFNCIGQQTSISQPTGNEIHIVYDSEGRVISVYDKLGTIALREYDDNGNLTKELDGNGNSIKYEFDILNRLVKTTDEMEESTEFVYDANDNLVSAIDRNGSITSQNHDALNRRIARIDAIGNMTAFGYDEENNLTTLTDAHGNPTTYDYDDNNRLTKETFADGTTKIYTYDDIGNLKTRTDNNGDLTKYTYDNRNRLIFRDYPGMNDIDDTFAYDDTGRMIIASNSNAAITFTYDPAGRLSSETLNGKITTYNNDIPNRTLTLVYPSGQVVVEEMDERGRIIRITSNGEEVARFYFDSSNRVMARTYANGTIARYTYNESNWATSLQHANASGIFAGFNYAFDKEGNKKTEEKLRRSDRSEKYDYDDNYRLIDFRRGDLSTNTYSFEKTFNYDALGNRDTVAVNGIVSTYASSEMNEYTAIGGLTNLQYDENGNLTFDGVNTFGYDGENRMIVVDGGATGKYKFDAMGRRVEKITAEGTVQFLYDGARVIEERDGTDTLEASYVYGVWIDEVLIMQRNGTDFFYHQNSLGSVSAISDFDGELKEQYDYNGYGEAIIFDDLENIITDSPAKNPYFFTSRRIDSETGLYYYRARYYDPEIGRFIQKDPYLNISYYTYASNNPINRTDPLGLQDAPGHITGRQLHQREGEEVVFSNDFLGGTDDLFTNLFKVNLYNDESSLEISHLMFTPTTESSYPHYFDWLGITYRENRCLPENWKIDIAVCLGATGDFGGQELQTGVHKIVDSPERFWKNYERTLVYGIGGGVFKEGEVTKNLFVYGGLSLSVGNMMSTASATVGANLKITEDISINAQASHIRQIDSSIFEDNLKSYRNEASISARFGFLNIGAVHTSPWLEGFDRPTTVLKVGLNDPLIGLDYYQEDSFNEPTREVAFSLNFKF